LGWGKTPITCDSSWLVRHDDLFQGRVAGALADAVDGAFDLTGPGFDRGERVGHGQPEVVVAMRAEYDTVGARNALPHGAEHRCVLDRQGIPHRVRKIDRGRARGDGRFHDAAQKLQIAARRVLGRELNVVRIAAGALHGLACPLEALVAAEPQLALEMQVGGGDDDVHPGPRSRSHGLTGQVDVPVVAARERGDHGTAHGLGDRPDAPPVAFRRTREPRFDHVHPERVQLSGKTQLLLGRHRIAGRLLAVAQGGVEDDDVSPHEWLPCSPSRVDGEKKAADLLGSAALTASFLYR